MFLDTNYLMNLVEKRKRIDTEILFQSPVYISPLSIHILFYVTQKKVPDVVISEIIRIFSYVPVTEDIIQKAAQGPTDDFEDNVQLHSAAEAECDYFFTEDKRLLAMKFFGKTHIVAELHMLRSS